MRRLWLSAVAVALAAWVLAAPSFAAGGKARLSPVPGETFPHLSFALTLPTGRELSPGDVTVRENGRPVSRPSVTPAHAVGKEDFGTVLVIDATATMRGRPIRDALVAARAFARKRNAQQRLAIVTFNRATTVALPLTTDGGAIQSALSTPPRLANNGTHLYDAVAQAIVLLKQAHIRAGSVLLLSDGADTGSKVSEQDAAAAAKAAGVRVYTIGLRSRSFDRGALKTLAAGAHGDYAEARKSSDLAPIYVALGSRLANEYLIQYRSFASRGSAVHVEVTAAGVPGSVTSDYATPPLPSRAGGSAKASGFWGSAASMIAVSFTCALLIGLAVVAVLWRRPQSAALSDRLRGFVSAPPDEPERAGPTLTNRVLGEAERSLEQTSWWPKFKEELEIAQIEMPAIRIVTLTSLGTIVALWVLFALTGSPLAALLAFGIPFGVRAFLKHKLDSERKLFADQLADNLQVIASGMRAGHSFAGALALAVEDSPEPAKRELGRVVADEKLGVPLEEALTVVVRRMESEDLEQAVLVAMLQRETGGNMAEVIDRVADTIRERAELRRIVRTLTAQGRLSRWVVTVLPVALLAIITLINPEYMKPLFSTATGQALLVVAVGMIAIGSFVIRRIVDFKV